MVIHRDIQIDICMEHFKILVGIIDGNIPDSKLGLSSKMCPQYWNHSISHVSFWNKVLLYFFLTSGCRLFEVYDAFLLQKFLHLDKVKTIFKKISWTFHENLMKISCTGQVQESQRKKTKTETNKPKNLTKIRYDVEIQNFNTFPYFYDFFHHRVTTTTIFTASCHSLWAYKVASIDWTLYSCFCNQNNAIWSMFSHDHVSSLLWFGSS